jgi:heptaprenyl diphosphate synthase
VNPVAAEGLANLASDLDRLDLALEAAVDHEDHFLAEVGSHLLSGTGKRVRSTLTIVSSYAVAGIEHPACEQAIVGGTACELVHMGSLYHDDVIDEAEMRRGVPSVNARWSNIVAILAGDFLLARASSLAASLGANVAALLATTIAELCHGEVSELQHLFDVERSEENYYASIQGKTASLFAASCRLGGIVTDAPPPTVDALESFGRHLGVCFQIIDDCLDLTSTDLTLGKPAGADLIGGIYTLPVIYGLRRSPSLRGALAQPATAETLDDLRAQVLASGGVEAARCVAIDHATKAMDAIRGARDLDPSVTRWMNEYADNLIARAS